MSNFSINTSNTNNTLDDPSLSSELRRILGAIGIVAAVINLFILIVFFSSKRLLKTSALLVGLTVGHACNGLVHAMYGFWSAENLSVMTSPTACIRMVWPNLFITTYQLLPLLLALAGAERLVALLAPHTYRASCTNRRLWLVTALAFAHTPLSMVINWAVAGWIDRGPSSIPACIPPMVIGVEYMIYGAHLPAVLGGLCAAVCTSIGVIVGRRRTKRMPSSSQGEISRVNKQIRLAQCLLMISAIDVICVVTPNIVLILFNSDLVLFPLSHTTYLTMIYCGDSILNISAFLVFNREFRNSSMRLLRRCGKAQVTPAPTGGEGSTVAVIKAS